VWVPKKERSREEDEKLGCPNAARREGCGIERAVKHDIGGKKKKEEATTIFVARGGVL